MKKQSTSLILVLLLCLSLLPINPASALIASGNGTLRRAWFEDSGITFQAPASFTLDSIQAGKSSDVIKLVGPKDINNFIPSIFVRIKEGVSDLSSIPVSNGEDYITNSLNGSNVLNLVDEITAVGDKQVLRRVYFYNTSNDRMGIYYMYVFNVDTYSITVEYRAYTATRSLPDDVIALPDVVSTFAINK